MPDKWLAEHPEPTLEEVAAEVSRLHYEADRAHTTTKIAVGALIFAAVSSGLVWVYADRVADQAKADAIREAEIAREEADRGLCSLIGDFIRADTPARDPRLRKSLAEAYTDPKCVPPLVDGKLPPLPSATDTRAPLGPTLAPPASPAPPTAAPSQPQASIGEASG
jgi:hypothetical protein